MISGAWQKPRKYRKVHVRRTGVRRVGFPAIGKRWFKFPHTSGRLIFRNTAAKKFGICLYTCTFLPCLPKNPLARLRTALNQCFLAKKLEICLYICVFLPCLSKNPLAHLRTWLNQRFLYFFLDFLSKKVYNFLANVKNGNTFIPFLPSPGERNSYVEQHLQ